MVKMHILLMKQLNLRMKNETLKVFTNESGQKFTIYYPACNHRNPLRYIYYKKTKYLITIGIKITIHK